MYHSPVLFVMSWWICFELFPLQRLYSSSTTFCHLPSLTGCSLSWCPLTPPSGMLRLTLEVHQKTQAVQYFECGCCIGAAGVMLQRALAQKWIAVKEKVYLCSTFATVQCNWQNTTHTNYLQCKSCVELNAACLPYQHWYCFHAVTLTSTNISHYCSVFIGSSSDQLGWKLKSHSGTWLVRRGSMKQV